MKTGLKRYWIPFRQESRGNNSAIVHCETIILISFYSSLNKSVEVAFKRQLKVTEIPPNPCLQEQTWFRRDLCRRGMIVCRNLGKHPCSSTESWVRGWRYHEVLSRTMTSSRCQSKLVIGSSKESEIARMGIRGRRKPSYQPTSIGICRYISRYQRCPHH